MRRCAIKRNNNEFENSKLVLWMDDIVSFVGIKG